MPLVPAICTQCGAALQVESTADASICQHCGTPFITEKAINNYNVTNNISAGVVNVYGGDSSGFVIRAGVLERYNGAATDVVIPEGVIKINQRAFDGCDGLTSVVIPEGVTRIGAWLFARCRKLTSVVIPNSVTEIGEHTFDGCTELASIVIPEGVTEIGEYAFNDCSGLMKAVILPKYVSGSHLFDGCKSLIDVTISDQMWRWCSVHITDFLDETPYYRERKNREWEEARPIREAMEEKKRQGICYYCGGNLNIFNTKCKSCGERV